MIINTDVAVIGGGPAGLAAAIAAHDQGARVTLIERDRRLGGILQQCIHNGFGLHYFGEELTGPEYAQRFVDMLARTDVQVLTDTMVLSITPEHVVHAVSAEHGLIEVRAKALVLAMGCRERKRGALDIPGQRPSGIFPAGCAQRLVNMEGLVPGREIVILGSGDIGLIMARRFTWEGARVKMVCELMPYSSGLTRNIVQCLDDYDIPLRFEHTVTRIHGRERLTGVTVAKVDLQRKPIPGTEEFISCDTLLLSVGLIPENELLQDLPARMDPVTGGAMVNQYRQTDLPGVFACGNVLHVHDLVDNVSQEAMLAGGSAARYALGALLQNERVEVRPGAHVRYTVPHFIEGSIKEPLELYFRVDNIHRNVSIEVLLNGQCIKKRRRAVVTPGEMEKITLKAQDGPIRSLTVRVTAGGQDG